MLYLRQSSQMNRLIPSSDAINDGKDSSYLMASMTEKIHLGEKVFRFHICNFAFVSEGQSEAYDRKFKKDKGLEIYLKSDSHLPKTKVYFNKSPFKMIKMFFISC